MTPQSDGARDDSPLSREQFHADLTALLERAQDGNFRLKGAYDVYSAGDSVPNYTVEISEVSRLR